MIIHYTASDWKQEKVQFCTIWMLQGSMHDRKYVRVPQRQLKGQVCVIKWHIYQKYIQKLDIIAYFGQFNDLLLQPTRKIYNATNTITIYCYKKQ